MSPGRFAVIVASIGVLSSWGTRARAECVDDSACPRGFTCAVTGTSSCGGAAPPARNCPDDANCDPAEAPAPLPLPPDCAPQVYRSCVPGRCTSDSDCAPEMVCFAQETGTCTAPAQPPCQGGVCPPRVAPTCTSETTRSCVPRYLLPCQEGSDCGAGFTCEPQLQCGCSGSAGTPTPGREPVPVDGGAAPVADAGIAEDRAAPALPPACSCTPTAEKYCKPQQLTCLIDADCPASWSCQTAVADVDRPACLVPAGADAGTCSADVPAAAASRCVPPYDGVNVGAGHPARGEDGTPTTAGSGSANAPVPPANPPTENEDGDGDAAPSTVRHVRSCAVAGPGSGGSFGFWSHALSLAAAASFFSRRRR